MGSLKKYKILALTVCNPIFLVQLDKMALRAVLRAKDAVGLAGLSSRSPALLYSLRSFASGDEKVQCIDAYKLAHGPISRTASRNPGDCCLTRQGLDAGHLLLLCPNFPINLLYSIIHGIEEFFCRRMSS